MAHYPEAAAKGFIAAGRLGGYGFIAIQSIIGGETSSPIKSATTYTLKCLDLQVATQTKTATVQILPTFQEQ
jgi:hypothetical protein